MILATNILLAVLFVAAPLSVWLAWSLRDAGPGDGRGEPEVDLSWSPDPGGLEVDWDSELAGLMAGVR